MTLTTVLDFVSVFFAGMLAGIEFVIHYGMRSPAEILDERSQLQFRQALVLRLRVLVPAFFVPEAILGVVLTVLNSTAPGFGFRCAGVIALLTWIRSRGGPRPRRLTRATSRLRVPRAAKKPGETL